MAKDNIALIGFYGQRKNEIGKLLAEKLSMEFCDTTELIEYEYAPIEELYKLFGEIGYRKYEKVIVKQVCGYQNAVIAVGAPTLSIGRNAELLQDSAVTIYLIDKTKTLFEVAKGKHQNFIKKPTYKAFHDEFKSLKPTYVTSDISIRTDNLSNTQIVDKIIAKVMEMYL
ncbi:MAG: shikimate kinase [Clostridia bacterium]